MPDSASLDPPPRDLKSQLRRRVPFYLLVLGLGVLVMQYYERQPSEVVVDFQLGAARVDLRRMSVRYQRGQELLHRATFTYTKQRPAPRSQLHTVRVPDGDHDLIIELSYGSTVPKSIRTRTRPLGKRAVRMRRFFPVRGSGRVAVTIAEES